MQISNPNYKNISFGNSRKNQYTAYQIKVMRDIKKAALVNDWCDIYTGQKFSEENPPTIEHILPSCLKKTNKDRIKKLQEKGFQLHGLDNIFPAGSLGNSTRSNKSLSKAIQEDPSILERLLLELEKYKRYKSDLIDGKDWVRRLFNTLQEELNGIYSDLKTRKIFIK